MRLPLGNFIRIKILDFVRGTNQARLYEEYVENQYKYSKEDILRYQSEKFNEIFRHHFEKNKAYREFVLSKGFKDKGFVTPEDVPVITKDFLKGKSDHFISDLNHTTKHSGGSTGVPLTIHLSKNSVESFWPSIWRSFDVYGVKPCDNIIMIAGPSLFNDRSFKRKIYDFINRFKVISAFDLSVEHLHNAYKYILKNDVKAIYGYTSSVLVFLDFLKKNDLKINLRCIYTTSETFIPAVRRLARECCDCDVIDTYGANDGGVFGFECQNHSGYHLNFERTYSEIIDNEIIITDLLNTSAPFIRYKVGDYTTSEQLITDACDCGRTSFRLKNISGRINQFVIDLDGMKIHTEFFSHIFGEDNFIKQFQIIQSNRKLKINVLHGGEIGADYFLKKYSGLIETRFKMPFELVFNHDVLTSSNMKTPIFINNDEAENNNQSI